MQKTEARQRRISVSSGRLSRQKGQIEWVMGMFWVLFLGILLSAILQLKAYAAASLYMEDALAASNLAGAIIDVQEYGISNQLVIADMRGAYEKFCEALTYNLQLNEEMEGTNRALVSGRVVIENFTIYNVTDLGVEVYGRNTEGNWVVSWESLGNCVAPNGVTVVSTSIYSEISFPIQGIFGTTVTADKGKLVDVVAQRYARKEKHEKEKRKESNKKVAVEWGNGSSTADLGGGFCCNAGAGKACIDPI